jgi:hypothetical protein
MAAVISHQVDSDTARKASSTAIGFAQIHLPGTEPLAVASG